MVERVENLVTIKGVVNGAFMPASKNRLLTDVVLQEGFHIRGGLYANNLTIEGAGTVAGPVMAKRDIIIHPPQEVDKRISLRCGLSARLAIATQVPDTFPYSPVNREGFFPLFVRGDVISESVSLENTVVIGNVFARNAVVKDSIVVGCLLTEDRLVMRNSMAISFRAGSVELINRNSLWVPYGLVQSEIVFTEYRADQEENNQAKVLDTEGESPADDANTAWLRYLGLCRTTEHGCGKSFWFRCHKHLGGTCQFKDVRMTDQDIVLLKRGDKKFKAITLAPRLIDLRKVEMDMEEMVNLLTRALYFEHYHATSQRQIMGELEEQRQKSRTGLLQPHYQFLEEVAKFVPLADRETKM